MSKSELQFVEREDLVPKCPHCQTALNEVFMKHKGLGFIEGRNVLYFCPHCFKVLGVGQSRMM